MKTVKDFNFKGKKVLLRLDLNVPLSEKGDVLDDFRITQSIPTIQYLISQKAKVILMSHLGRPDGKIVEELKMDVISERLSDFLGFEVEKTNDILGKDAKEKSDNLKEGEVLLLENLRFDAREEDGNLEFAKELSLLGEIYINDAFGTCHRDHASISGVPQFLESGAGLLLEKEISSLERVLKNSLKPLVVLMGGSKVETKVDLISNFLEKANFVLLGELIEKELKEKGIELPFPEKLIFPVDSEGGGLDIGEETIKIFKEKISLAKTIFFNGVMGRVEEPPFDNGTREILKAISESSAFSVVGGGDMTELIKKMGLIESFGHVSTGGGAMMSFLSGKELPGLKVLGYGN